MTVLLTNGVLKVPCLVVYNILIGSMIHSRFVIGLGLGLGLGSFPYDGDERYIRQISLWTPNKNSGKKSFISSYGAGDPYECLLSEPTLVSPCWESIDTRKICLEDKPYLPSKIVHGLETHSSVVLEPCMEDDFESCVPSELCYEKAKTLLNDIIGIQCLPEPYCDMIVICQTTCGEAVENQKRQQDLERMSLGFTSKLTEDVAVKRSKYFYLGVLITLMILGVAGRAYFVAADYVDESSFSMNVFNWNMGSSSKPTYSRVAAAETADDDQEMVSLKDNSS